MEKLIIFGVLLYIVIFVLFISFFTVVVFGILSCVWQIIIDKINKRRLLK